MSAANSPDANRAPADPLRPPEAAGTAPVPEAAEQAMTPMERALSSDASAAPAGWRLRTVPNALTMARLASAPIFLAIWMNFGRSADPARQRLGLWIALVIVTLSELSDLLDGYIARRMGQVSNFGKLMDPFADSIFRLTVFFCFASEAYGKWIPLWMVVLLFYRDVMTAVIRTFGMRRGKVIPARISGKVKAVAQSAALFALLGYALVRTLGIEGSILEELGDPDFRKAATWVMGGVVIVAILSGVEYLWENRRIFREET